MFFRIVYAVTVSALPAALRPWGSALLEISAGCADFAALGGPVALYGICFCLSVWGVSVFVQLRSLLGPQTPWKPLLASRALHMVLLQVLVRLCVHFAQGGRRIYQPGAARGAHAAAAPDAAVVVFCFLCAVLYKIRQRFYNK